MFISAANNNCIPAHSGGNGSLIILHGAARGGCKPDPRLTDPVVGRSHDLRQPGSVVVGGGGAPVSSNGNDVLSLSTLTELKPLQTYAQQPGYMSPYPAPYDGAFCTRPLCSGFSRQCSDTVGWATERASGL